MEELVRHQGAWMVTHTLYIERIENKNKELHRGASDSERFQTTPKVTTNAASEP